MVYGGQMDQASLAFQMAPSQQGGGISNSNGLFASS